MASQRQAAKRNRQRERERETRETLSIKLVAHSTTTQWGSPGKTERIAARGRTRAAGPAAPAQYAESRAPLNNTRICCTIAARAINNRTCELHYLAEISDLATCGSWTVSHGDGTILWETTACCLVHPGTLIPRICRGPPGTRCCICCCHTVPPRRGCAVVRSG